MDDDDEVLRQALEESLRLHETHQRSNRRRESLIGELEERVLRESEATATAAAAQQDTEDDEADVLMQVIRQSIADEEARAERRRRELEELHRREARFGSRNGTARASTSSRDRDDARPRNERILQDRPLREEPEEYGSDSTRGSIGVRSQRQRPSNSRTGRGFHRALSEAATRANSLGTGRRDRPRQLTSGESSRSRTQSHLPRQRMSEDETRPSVRSCPPRQRAFGELFRSRAPRETASTRRETYPERSSLRVSPPESDDGSISSDDDSTSSDDDYDDDDDRRTPPQLIRRQRVPSPPSCPPWALHPLRRAPRQRPPPQRARTTRSPSPPRQQRRRTTDPRRPRPRPPSDYDEEEVLARSRREAFPTGPFTEEGEEFNHHQLQAAINESAGQGRDEEEEAIERNRGIPTYEEACAMERYKAPRGKKYVFQGPSSVTLEGENGNPGVTMKVIGDMDLGVALKIANGGTDSRLGRSVGK